MEMNAALSFFGDYLSMAAISDTSMTRTLAQAAHAVGGLQVLASKLGVTTATMQDWLSGASEAPAAIYVRALDILIAASKQTPPR